MFIVTVFGDPVRKPAETIFRAVMIGAAGVVGAFFWVLFREPHGPPASPEKESETKSPTAESRIRRRKHVRLATRRNQDGTRDTVFETDEEHFE